MGLTRTLIAGLLLSTFCLSAARGQGVFGGGDQLIGVLAEPSVKRELQLDDGQSEKAAKATQAFLERERELGQRARKLGPAEGREEMASGTRKNVADYKAELASFLTPEQLTRLRQITLQRLQGEAFADPDLLDDLKLTEGQRAKVEEIRARRMEKVRQVSGLMRGDPKNGAAVVAAAKAVDQEQTDAILGMLTESQREQWHEMLGPRFNRR